MSTLSNVKIEGGIVNGVNGEKPGVTIFKAIPYAAPPIGNLRWRPPQLVPSWSGVKACDKFSKICPQAFQPAGGFYRKEFYDYDPEVSEDCLYLNVWTPAKTGTEKLPVAIYVHGGSFDHGWSYEKEFDGEAFSAHNVILVSINYRVNVFGFLAHPLLSANPDTKYSGNVGILDVICAVKWVHNNISGFGGDPANVTLFGQSAGSYLSLIVSASKETKGLIKNVICQSGIGYGDNSLQSVSPAEANELGEILLEPFHPKSVEELYSISTEDLHKRFVEYAKTQNKVFVLPHIDGEIVESNFTTAVKQGALHPSNFIIGSNSKDIFDDLFNTLSIEFSQELIKLPNKRAFVYYFDRTIPGEDNPGGFHSAELWYMFGTYPRCWRPFDKYDAELSDKMVSYWCNFITNGDPNGAGLEKWPEIKPNQSLKIKFGDTISTIQH